MSILRKMTALLLSLVMIASMGATMAFAEGEGGTGVGRSSGGNGGEPVAGYVFGQFARGQGATPVGASSITFDAADKDKKELAIYKTEDGTIKNTRAIDLDMSKFTYSTNCFELIKSNQKDDNSPFNAVELINIRADGITEVSYQLDANTTVSIEVTIKNYSSEPPSEERFFTDLTVLMEDGTPGGKFRLEKKHLGDSDMTPHAFALATIRDNIQDSPPVLTRIFPDDMTIELKQIAGEPGKLKDNLWLGKDEKGNDAFYIRSKDIGKYEAIIRFTSPISEENTSDRKRELRVVYEVIPAISEQYFEVGEGKKYATIQSAIDAAELAGGSTADGIKFVKVFPGNYTENLTISKWVIVEGTDDNDFSKVILNGTVTFAAPQEEGGLLTAQISKMTLKNTAPSQTGITTSGSDGYGRINAMIVDGFQTGATVGKYLSLSGSEFKNCQTAITMDYSDRPGRTTIRALNFDRNETAIEVLGADNTYAIALFSCNFTNNDMNIVNSAGKSLTFAYNYFGYGDGFNYDKDLKSKFSDNVVFSPYYRAPIVKKENGDLTQPKIAFIDPSAFAGLEMEAALANKAIDTQNFVGAVNITLANVNSGDASVAKAAGWAFAAADAAKAAAFNPSIETQLKGGSDAAANRLPAGVKYQPVSFAHSGALPGIAAVSVVKDADAPTVGNLRLYKVVGNGLVLQPDPVTFTNNEFIFNRDSASDYIITDTDLNIPDTSNSNSNNGSTDGSSGGSGGGYTDSGEVGGKLESTPAGGTASLDVSSKPNVGISSFDLLKKDKSKTLLLRGDGYSWSFKGADLLNNVPGLMTVNTTISKTSPNAEAIKKLTGDSPIMNVYFSFHGQLPGKATIELEVDSKLGGKPLNLYYYNSATGQLSLVKSGLAVKNGKVSFDITHCSDYLLTPDVILGAGAAAVGKVVNPDTGAHDLVPLALAIALLSGLGAAALLCKKKK